MALFHGLEMRAVPSLDLHSLMWIAPPILLLCWRLWRFTISPLFRPNEPKEVPYWIPYIGHALAFFKDYNGAIESGRKYFRNSTEPYSMWIPGMRIYIVTAPEDVAKCSSTAVPISYHNSIKDMYRGAGATKWAAEKMFTVDPALNPRIVPNMVGTGYLRQETNHGKGLNALLDTTTASMLETLDLKSNGPATLKSLSSVHVQHHGCISVSLLQLCRELFIRSTMIAFFGPVILDIDPKLHEAFDMWDRLSWKYMFHLPAFLSRDALAERNKCISALTKYLALPKDDRKGGSEFIGKVQELMRGQGLSEDDIARVMFLWTWAALSNVHKVGFWTIAFLAYDANLASAIRDEVATVAKDGLLDDKTFPRCAKLDALISETLRLTVLSALVREVDGPVELSGKILRPGSQLLIPYHQLHLSTTTWGPDALTMSPERFLTDAKLLASKSYRPFGGGAGLCPGRHLARMSIAYGVALLLTRFDVEVEKMGDDGGLMPAFPKVDATKPTPGASLPFEGVDVRVVLERRE